MKFNRCLSVILAVFFIVSCFFSIPLETFALSENARYYNSLPEKFYLIKGETLAVYFDNIVSLPNMKVAFDIPDGVVRKLYSDRIEFTAASSGDYKVGWRVYDQEYVLSDSGEFTLCVRKNKLKKLNVIVIGDSTIDQNVTTAAMHEFFEKNGVTLNLLGTRGDGSFNNHEGRKNWHFNAYCQLKESAGVENPFYNNGFDFSYYMENQGYKNVDAVIIQLGINDVKKFNLENYNSKKSLNSCRQMIDSIKEYDSGISVILSLPTMPNADDSSYDSTTVQNPFECRNNMVHFSNDLLNEFQNEENVYISAVNCSIDSKTQIRDRIHPTDEGYELIGQRHVAALNYILNPEATPEPASITSATYTSGAIDIKWTSMVGVESYSVFREDVGLLEETTKNYFKDKTAKSGKTYKYFIRTYYESGYVYDSQKVSVSALDTPKLKVSENTAKGVRVKWDSVKGAESYFVFRKSPYNSSWKKIAAVKTNLYEDTKVKSGEKYTYTVRAAKGSDLSGYDVGGITASFIATPKLTSLKNSNAKTVLTWSAVNGAKGYYVYRKTSKTGKWSKVANVKGTSYTDKNVVSGKNYFYTVRAYNGKVMSYYVTSGIATKYLSIPKLSKTVSKKAGITVSYKTVKGATGYAVYRKTANSKWSKIGTASGNNKTSFLDKTAKKGVKYTYTVRAINGKYLSGYDSKGLTVKDLY